MKRRGGISLGLVNGEPEPRVPSMNSLGIVGVIFVVLVQSSVPCSFSSVDGCRFKGTETARVVNDHVERVVKP